EVAPRVDVRHRLAVVAHLIIVSRAAVGDRVRDTVEDALRADIGGDFLRLGMSERHDDAAAPPPERALNLLRRNEAGRACGLLSHRRPLAPGLEFGAPLLVLRFERRGVRRSDRCRSLRRRRRLTQLEPNHSGHYKAGTYGDRCQTNAHAILHWVQRI